MAGLRGIIDKVRETANKVSQAGNQFLNKTFEPVGNKVQAAEKKVTTAVKTAPKRAVQVVKNKVNTYFAPSTTVRARDIVRELPTAGKKVIVQEMLGRPLAAIGATVAHPGKAVTVEPKTKVDKFLVGDEPVRNMKAAVEVNAPNLQQKYNLSPEMAKTIAGGGFLLGTVGSFVPAGKGVTTAQKLERAANLIAKTEDTAKVAKVFKAIKLEGVSDDIVKTLAAEKDAGKIKNVLLAIAEKASQAKTEIPQIVQSATNKLDISKKVEKAAVSANKSSKNIVADSKAVVDKTKDVFFPKIKGGNGKEIDIPILKGDFATRLNSKGKTVNILDKNGNLVDGDLQTAIQEAIDAGADKFKLGLHNQSPVRNIEDIFGKNADIVKSYLPEIAAKNETAKVKWVNDEVNQLRESLISRLGLKLRGKEDVLAHRFAEKRITLNELKKEAPSTWQNVVEAANITRAKYDDYLEKINTALKTAGYEPVAKRDDYITHLNELNVANNIFGNLLNIPKEKLPAIMSGIHLNTKPGRQWFGYGKERQGGPFIESVLNALDAYIPAAGNQIFHTDTAQKARTFQKVLNETLKKQPETQSLSNFTSWVNDYVNGITGKGSILDRSLEETIGRQIPAALQWLKSRTGANMVGANITSAITNFIPITQSLATTGKKAAARGLIEAFAAPFSKKSTIIDGIESSFLTRRFASYNKRLAENLVSKTTDTAGLLFKDIDQFTSSAIVRGKYYEMVAKGVSKDQAMAFADDYAARIMTDRSFGQMPTIYNSKTLGLITQFQAEVNNQISFLLKDIPRLSGGNKLKIASALTQVAIYSYVFNEMFEKVTGRRPAIDPIQMTADTIADFQQDRDNKWGRLIKRVADQLPYASTFTGGGRIPLSAAVPSITKLINGTADVADELSKPLYYLFPPTGGGQIKKTIEGAKTLINDGKAVSKSGEFRYPIGDNFAEKAKVLIFGPSAGKLADTFYDSELGSITGKNERLYDYLVGNGYTREKAYATVQIRRSQQDYYNQYKKINQQYQRKEITQDQAQRSIYQIEQEYLRRVQPLSEIVGQDIDTINKTINSVQSSSTSPKVTGLSSKNGAVVVVKGKKVKKPAKFETPKIKQAKQVKQPVIVVKTTVKPDTKRYFQIANSDKLNKKG